MTDAKPGWPGFHAIMMAAAYAEEGLAGHAREILREAAAGRREPPAKPERGRAPLPPLGTHGAAGRTA